MTIPDQELMAMLDGKVLSFEHRLKPFESLTRKIDVKAKLFLLEPEVAGKSITDILAYRLICSEKDLIGRARILSERIPESGFSLRKINNYFGSGSNYEGLHFVFSNGTIHFEMQFHTQESLRILTMNTQDYWVNRAETVSQGLRDITNEWMIKKWDGFTRPDDYELFPVSTSEAGIWNYYVYASCLDDRPLLEEAGPLFRLKGTRAERYEGKGRWTVPPFAGEVWLDTTGAGGDWADVVKVTHDEAEQVSKRLFPGEGLSIKNVRPEGN